MSLDLTTYLSGPSIRVRRNSAQFTVGQLRGQSAGSSDLSPRLLRQRQRLRHQVAEAAALAAIERQQRRAKREDEMNQRSDFFREVLSLDALPRDQVKLLEPVFDFFDRDRDGFLTESEFVHFSRALGVQVEKEPFLEVLKSLPISRKRRINMNFKTAMNLLATAEETSDLVAEAFGMIEDTTIPDNITLSSLHRMTKAFAFNDEMLEAMMGHLQQNDSETVTRQRFLDFIRSFL